MSIRQDIRRTLFKGSTLLRRMGTAIYRSMHEEQVWSWFADKGDSTLRLDYDLNSESIVFDLGGYIGQWTSDIFGMYCCRVYVFEPVPVFYEDIKRRFQRNPKIHVYPYGLGNANKPVIINLDGASSSIYRTGNGTVEGRIVRAADFLSLHNISTIDLMKINIEGGEYDLLDHLIKIGCIEKITNLQVQFHDVLPESRFRMAHIQAQLEQTHHLTYQYPFVWENWRLEKCVDGLRDLP